jgi:CSLREA domain-containing protein
MRVMRAGLAAVGPLLCIAVGAAAANAATITVTTTADESTPGDGLCALREAIIAVDSPGITNDCGMADPGANTIVLGAHTYPLTLDYPHLTIGPQPTGCVSGVSHPDNNEFGDLTITGNVQDLTIEGASPAQTVIDGCLLGDRVFNVLAGATVTIQDLTIINGHPPGGSSGAIATTAGQSGTAGSPGSNGGGILNAGSLTLSDVTVSRNHAGDGGSGGSSPNADTGSITGGPGGAGAIGGSGGGIYNSGTLTVSDSTISENSSGDGGLSGGSGQGSGTAGSGSGGAGGEGGGGAGIASAGSLTITRSTIDGNTAGAGADGSPGASDVATATAAAGNGGAGGAGGDVGGIAAGGGSLAMIDDTLTANEAGAGGHGGAGGNGPGGDIVSGGNGGNGGRGGDGGGIGTAGPSSALLLDLTVADNGAGTQQEGGAAGNPTGTAGANGAKGLGGGVFALAIGAHATLQNTILAANDPGGNCGTNALSSTSAFTDAGGNLDFAPPTLTGLTSGPGCPSTFHSGDPKLGPLQDNLGPTETMALQAGSAAIDQVPATGAGCPTTDQRGFKRPSGPACDIGAYEVTPPALSGVGARATGPNGATLDAEVTANAITASVEFEYGETESYGSDTSIETASGTQPTALSTSLSGLQPHTTYHFRVVATSPDGTTTSADMTFTTTRKPPKLSHLKVKLSHGKATVSYRDSLAARTTVILFSVEPGIKHRGKCVKPSKQLSGTACSRLVKLKRVTHADRQGNNSLSLTGLPKGRYRLEASPKLNGATGTTASTRFRVS